MAPFIRLKIFSETEETGSFVWCGPPCFAERLLAEIFADTSGLKTQFEAWMENNTLTATSEECLAVQVLNMMLADSSDFRLQFLEWMINKTKENVAKIQEHAKMLKQAIRRQIEIVEN